MIEPSKLLVVDRSWLMQLSIVVFVPFFMTTYSNVVSAMVFIICVWYIVISKKFEPFYILGAVLFAYLIVGGSNISKYRGDIDAETYSIVFVGIFMSLVGAFFARPTNIKKFIFSNAPKISGYCSISNGPSNILVFLSSVPPIAGALWMAQSSGIPLLNPALRFSVSPWALALIEMALVSIMLVVQRIIAREHVTLSDAIYIVLMLLLLTLPGYRGWIVLALGVIVVSLFQSHILEISVKKILVGIVMFAFFVVGVDYIRRDSSELLPVTEIKEHYSAESIPFGLAPVHFSLRETIALTQALLENGEKSGSDSILLADLKTVLPGKQVSGGALVAEQLGGRLQEGGLTPGALGVLKVELGWIGIIVLVVPGFVLGVVWRKSLVKANMAQYSVLFGCLLMYYFHYFHRGIPKVSYFFIPLVFIVLSKYGDKLLHGFVNQKLGADTGYRIEDRKRD